MIPEGEYGGGPVLLWDRGTWDAERATRASGLRRGPARSSRSHGREAPRRRGRSSGCGAATSATTAELAPRSRSATRTRGRRRSRASPTTRPESVGAAARIEEIARGAGPDVALEPHRPEAGRRAASPALRADARTREGVRAGRPGRPPRPLPEFVQPQLATLVAAPPAGDEWLHEMKFDGYRILCRIEKGAPRSGAATRGTGRRSFRRSPTPWPASRAPGAARRRDRRAPAERHHQLPGPPERARRSGRGELVVLRLRPPPPGRAGPDRRAARGRKRALEALVGAGRTARSATARTSSARARSSSARRAGWGWRVSSPSGATAPYEPGRGRSWLKVKCIHEQEFVDRRVHRARGARARASARCCSASTATAGGLALRGQGRHGLHRTPRRAPPRAARPARARPSLRSRAAPPGARRPAG